MLYLPPMRSLSLLLSLVFTAFLFVSSLLSAQVDSRAENLISKAQRQVKRTDDMSAQFKYFLFDRAEKTMVQEMTGVFKMKGDKYYLDMAGQEVFCNGNTVWDYRAEFEEVNITEFDPEMSFGLQQVFALLEEDMKMRFDGEEAAGGVSCEKATLFPKGKGTDFFKAEIWISTGDNLPRKLTVWNKLGTVATYEITSLNTDVKLEDQVFEFNTEAYPNVEVVDLR